MPKNGLDTETVNRRCLFAGSGLTTGLVVLCFRSSEWPLAADVGSSSFVNGKRAKWCGGCRRFARFVVRVLLDGGSERRKAGNISNVFEDLRITYVGGLDFKEVSENLYLQVFSLGDNS